MAPRPNGPAQPTETAPKAQSNGAATAVAEPTTSAPAGAEPTPTPQTPEQIAATEKALGLGPTDKRETTNMAIREGVRMGVAPRNLEEGWRLAQFIAASELVPKGYRGRPADVLVAMQYGLEVGLPPMAALHSVYVTNGRPSLWGDGFLAVIMASSVYRDHHEYYVVDGAEKEFLVAADLAKDDTMAVTTFWRHDSQRPRTATFSIAKAKKAGLWTKSGPWTDYPDRMLKYRARGFAGHDAFPDVLRGIKSAEEIIDIGPEPEPEAPREVKRISETKPGAVEQATNEGSDGTGPDKNVIPVPPVDDVMLDAALVTDVEQYLGGFTVTLGNGMKIDMLEAADAMEIEKFKGTKHKVRLMVTRDAKAGTLLLKSFAIAD